MLWYLMLNNKINFPNNGFTETTLSQRTCLSNQGKIKLQDWIKEYATPCAFETRMNDAIQLSCVFSNTMFSICRSSNYLFHQVEFQLHEHFRFMSIYFYPCLVFGFNWRFKASKTTKIICVIIAILVKQQMWRIQYFLHASSVIEHLLLYMVNEKDVEENGVFLSDFVANKQPEPK